jgi:hypothetical protein
MHREVTQSAKQDSSAEFGGANVFIYKGRISILS